MPFADEEDDPIAQRLNAMSRLEPPAELRPAIMHAIRSDRARMRTPAVRSRRQVFAAGWALAAGIILVFVLVARPPDRRDLRATIAPAEVTMDVTRAEGAVRLELRSHRKVTISVRFDSKSAVLVAISGVSGASLRNDLTTFTLHAPSQRAAVVLRPRGNARSTTVVVSADGNEVIRREIQLSATEFVVPDKTKE